MTTDTKAIRAQMEALTGFTAGPWRDEDGVIQSQTTVWQNGVKQVGWDYATIRAEVADDWDQAANARLIAAAPDMRDTILALCDEVDRLRTIIDNLHHVEKKHRDTANDQFHRANRLRAENERLRAALRPFAAAADDYCDPAYDDDYSPQWAEFFVVRDFRRARAALAQKGGD